LQLATASFRRSLSSRGSFAERLASSFFASSAVYSSFGTLRGPEK
jgi:hypothetical protein